MSDDDGQDRAVSAISTQHLWRACHHDLAKPDHHRCPSCGGTLRRCCFSLVGSYDHRAGCPEVGRRRGEDVA